MTDPKHSIMDTAPTQLRELLDRTITALLISQSVTIFVHAIWGIVYFLFTLVCIRVLIIAFSLVIAYLGVSVNNIFAPPELIIKTPHEQSLITDNRTVQLEGITEKEVALTVNDRPILSDKDGIGVPNVCPGFIKS